jgi:hypothetical protein
MIADDNYSIYYTPNRPKRGPKQLVENFFDIPSEAIASVLIDHLPYEQVTDNLNGSVDVTIQYKDGMPSIICPMGTYTIEKSER